MAVFMLNRYISVTVKATKITREDDNIVAWWNGEISAVFREYEIMGCWLEGGGDVK